jgi:hypothetical protein
MSFAWPVPLQAQGGCPAYPNASISLEDEVVEIYPLITAFPEAQPSLAQGVFIEQVFELIYEAGQQVWLTSYVEGSRLGDICTDDLAEVAISPSGQTWQHDFRSQDHQTILVSQAVDITYLFVPGVNIITLTLTDLTGPALSSSGYALVVVGPAIPPRVTPRPPTATPQLVATTTEVVTNTGQLGRTSRQDGGPRPEVPVGDAPASAVNTRTTVDGSLTPDPHPFRLWLWLIGFGAGFTLGLLWWRVRSRGPLPPGQVSLYDGMQFINTLDLTSFGKPVVTLGGEGADIELLDEKASVPAVVARISAQATNGKLQAIWEVLDPIDPMVIVEQQTLHHGDTVPIINQFLLEYSHYEVETTSYLEGEYINV